ncbi:MAG: ribonuclease VapC [Candidatus Aenigmatarchaeota archaeon]
MRVVIDTSGLIYLNDFRSFDEIFTVPEVIEEIKDRLTSFKFSTLNIRVENPLEKSIKEIEETAKKTGDLEKLSKTDIKLLALTKEKKISIVSDDRNIQNVAEKIGIKYISIFSKKISKLITWKKYCKNCKKFFQGKVCPICGMKLIKIPKKTKYILG